jgi:protein-S-isoprenylcysteine O-methyltransferase Ste14
VTSKRDLPRSFLFERQPQHILLLVGLVFGALYVAQPSLDGSTWRGIPDYTWFWAAIAVPIVHQLVVGLVFRAQLVFSLFTKLFGKYDMVVWGAIFLPFLLLRPITSVGLGLADSGTLGGPRELQIVVGLLLLIPVVYTLWSVARYFGLARALGGDHFRQKYRDMPRVTEGAYRYSSNAMYAFAFLLFWAIALLTGSRAALASALFQHAYIWVHMFCTEDPDMRVIYGGEYG